MNSVLTVLSNIRIFDVIDILIVAFVFYKIYMMIQSTRAVQLVKGLVILMIVSKLSEWAKLYVVNYILRNTFTLGLVAMLIIFQPELRKALEYIGRSKFMSKSMNDLIAEERREDIAQLVEAIGTMSRKKIGALVVIEQDTGINDIINTGTRLEAKITAQLLLNVFFPNSPMHDGAVVIRDRQVMAAGCLLPLSQNLTISKDLGTRHRAALGLVESSDALVIVVSEETGGISLAKDGKLRRYLDGQTLKNLLNESLLSDEPSGFFKKRWRVKND